jgi:peptide/nickel transport system ATP-binding protein
LTTIPTLVVQHLRTHFFTKSGIVKAVDGVDFTVMPGEVMGLVGESGSGKSMTGYSIIGLIDKPGRIVDGRILLKGDDLRACTPQQLRAIRGNRVAMIFQDPMMTLNPVLRIDTQMIEAITAHHSISRTAARERAREALARVGIASPEERLHAYPHQFSGGMRQRVTIQGQILYEMQKLCRESGAALIWITHDLSVVAGLADKVSVMYAGRIVEAGPVADVLESPRHPYTAGLIASTPAAATRSGRARGQPLAQIPGMTPSLLKLPVGCAFRERCNRASDICKTEPPLLRDDRGIALRCFHPLVAARPATARA